MDTGWLNPGTLVDDASIGTVAWTNPGNVASSNDVYATVTLNSGQTAHYIKATNFGAAVPVGKTITGVSVGVEAFATNGQAVGRIANTKLVIGGVISGDAWTQFALTAQESLYFLGAGSYKWNLSLTPGIVNASDFGVAVGANAFITNHTTVSIDHIRIKIFYVDTNPPNAGRSLSVSGLSVGF